jgi:ankyrin repeat protein
MREEREEKKDLFDTVMLNNISRVREMLRNNRRLVNIVFDGRTPLDAATERGRVEIVKLLLDEGADVNWTNEYGWTALYAAVYYGHIEIVKLLLHSGADVNKSNNNGGAALYRAIQDDNKTIVKLLLDSGADPNKADKFGRTPLTEAVQFSYNQIRIVELLLDSGADKDKANVYGRTPLYIAAYNGHIDTVKLLLDAGADINKADKWGWTPLRWAAHEGFDQIVKLFVKRMETRILFSSAMNVASIAESKGMNQDEAFLLFKATVKESMKDAGDSNFNVDNSQIHSKLYRYFKGVMSSRNKRSRTSTTGGSRSRTKSGKRKSKSSQRRARNAAKRSIKKICTIR